MPRGAPHTRGVFKSPHHYTSILEWVRSKKKCPGLTERAHTSLGSHLCIIRTRFHALKAPLIHYLRFRRKSGAALCLSAQNCQATTGAGKGAGWGTPAALGSPTLDTTVGLAPKSVRVKVFGRPSPSHAVISSAWGLSYPCSRFFVCCWGKTFSAEKAASTKTSPRGLLFSPASLLSPPPPRTVPGPPGTPHGSCHQLPLSRTSTVVTLTSQTPGNLNPPTDFSGSLGARRAFCRAPALSHAPPAGSTLQHQGLGAPTSPPVITSRSGFQRNPQLEQRRDLGIYLSWAPLKAPIRAQLRSQRSYAKNSARGRARHKSPFLSDSCESARFEDRRGNSGDWQSSKQGEGDAAPWPPKGSRQRKLCCRNPSEMAAPTAKKHLLSDSRASCTELKNKYRSNKIFIGRQLF